MDATNIMEKGKSESPTPSPPSGEVFDKDKSLYGNASESERERDVYEEGMQKYNRLGWKRLTIVLIVEAIALGSLSIPAAFASLGMVAGVICSVGIGMIAIYTAYIVGQVKVNFPQVANYPDAGRLMGGRWGYEIVNAMLILQLLFLVGSHCLTGTIAFQNITGSGICSIIFAVVSAIILMIIAIPPSFTEVAILGYVDFASIILAIGITIVATGVNSTKAPGGLAAVNWSAWPKEDLTFTEGFIAITNICFAYSFAMCQFSFMDEMHTHGFHEVRLHFGRSRDLYLHCDRRADLCLCRPGSQEPGAALCWTDDQPHRVWCCPASHFHQRLHQHHCPRTSGTYPHFQELQHPLRQHQDGMDHLDHLHHPRHYRRLYHCRSHPLLL